MRPEPITESDRQAMRDEMSTEAVLARFDGNATAALDAALHDIVYLRHELILAGLAMSYGYARGWKPKVLAH
ncbi:hypothetical protein [Aliihoeflea sp. PC F10.4]